MIAPGLLIAMPQLQDPNFRKSVVLLLQQGEDGALGVVINRETSLRLAELCSDHEIRYAGDPAKRVRLGGPVQPEQGIVLYGREHVDPEGQPVTESLHVSASTGTLSRLCESQGKRFQCYSGYAGWGPGQLEREISDGSWIIGEVDTRMVLDSAPDDIWLQALAKLGLDPAAIVPGGSDAS